MTYWYYQGLKALLDALKSPVTESGTGDLTTGSPTVANVANAADFTVGMLFESLGGNVPAGTTIIAKDGGASTLTLSANATGTQVGDTFFGFLPAIPGPLQAHLCEGAISQQPQNDFSVITEPGYTGYAPQNLVIASVPSDQAAYAWASGQCLKWEPTDYVTPATITGWCVTAPGSPQPVLLASEVFAAPIQLAQAGDIINMIPTLNLPFSVVGSPPSPIL